MLIMGKELNCSWSWGASTLHVKVVDIKKIGIMMNLIDYYVPWNLSHKSSGLKHFIGMDYWDISAGKEELEFMAFLTSQDSLQLFHKMVVECNLQDKI